MSVSTDALLFLGSRGLTRNRRLCHFHYLVMKKNRCVWYIRDPQCMNEWMNVISLEGKEGYDIKAWKSFREM